MEYDKGLIWEAFWKKKEQRAEKPNGLGCWWEVCGKSRGYWVEIVRDRRSGRREVEAQQTTKFEKHWVVVGAPKRPNGRSYTTRQSPYDPEPGYAGLWKGWTAPPRRIGPSAPRRWPAESDEPEKTVEISISANRWRSKWRPYGPRPYELKWDQTIASRTITDRLRLSNARHNYQRLRDQKAHILERRRRSGSLFRDKDGPTPAQFARGVRWAELEGIELYRRHDQLRWFVDRPITNRLPARRRRSRPGRISRRFSTEPNPKVRITINRTVSILSRCARKGRLA
jgi:hypothetical protein